MAAYDQFKNLLSARRFSEAVEFAERETLNNPSSEGFWMNQQVIALMKNEKYKRAAEVAQRSLALDPHNPYSLLFRSDAYFHLGDVEKALTGYEESVRIPKVTDRARKGILNCLVQIGEWERILSCIAQWGLSESDGVIYRVKALTNLQRSEEAISLCNEWLKKSPDNKQALWLLVNIEVERDGLEPVRSKYERLAKIPSKPPIYGEIYASLCRKAGKFDKALTQYEKMGHKTQDLSIARQKAFALAKSGHEQEAIPLLEELLRLDPTDMFLHTSYTGANKRLNTLERVWKFYRELIDKYPDEKTLLGRVRKVQKQLEMTGKLKIPDSIETSQGI
jgi:tetratricopeptide (TPR) repeat protein